MTTVSAPPLAHSLEIEALKSAARWPNASPRVALVLLGRLAAARRFADAAAFFDELARDRPDQPLLLAASGFAQARVEGQLTDALGKLDTAVRAEPGLPNFLRGTVLARLPSEFGRATDAIADLELVVALRERIPAGLRRAALRSLAGVYAAAGRDGDAVRALARSGFAADADAPALTVDYWVTERDGFRFVPPRLAELADGVHVAQGYDFADISFVRTRAGIVAIDAGSTPSNAAAALEELRAVTSAPITHVILTHSHWDHVGGLEALRGQDTEVIAQSGFVTEAARQGEIPLPWPRFLPAGAIARGDVIPDRTIEARTTLDIGGVEFVLTPAYGGETADALLVHVPERGVVFAGDILMPYLGAPFLAEGSAEGLLDAMRLVEDMAPAVVIHGHPPLTENFTGAVFPGLRTALESLYDTVRSDLRLGRTLSEMLQRNHLPDTLRQHPEAVLPYLLLRDNLVKRVHRQRTGYWQPDGEGIEDVPPEDWALALDLLAVGDEDRHAAVVRALVERDHLAVALRIADLALRRHEHSSTLAAVRQDVLVRLLERHQAMDPFKFIVYSGMSGLELPRPDL